MKTHHHHHPKLKTQPRPLFSCSFFRHCTQTALSPTTPTSPSLPLSTPSSTLPPPPSPPPLPPPPPPPQQSHQTTHKPHQHESSSSSSSSTSQSFTQWRFPLSNSPLHHHHHHTPPNLNPQPELNFHDPPTMPCTNLQELFHVAELQLSTGSESEQLAALHLLERSLVPNPPSDPVCSPELMRGVVANLKNRAGVKPATKVLLALCLAEGNRHAAVEAGAVGTVVEVAMELESAAAERALAVLELTCTVAEGAAELRGHALAVPVMVTMMGKMVGRGREYAISALSVIYGGGGGGSGEETDHAPPEEVGRAVALALQGECTARGRRKGAQLMKALEEYGRVDLTQEGNEGL